MRVLPSLPLREALSDAAFYAWFFSFTYPLLVLDVVRGVRRALALGHLDYRNFDVDECVGARRRGAARDARRALSRSRDVGSRAKR